MGHEKLRMDELADDSIHESENGKAGKVSSSTDSRVRYCRNCVGKNGERVPLRGHRKVCPYIKTRKPSGTPDYNAHIEQAIDDASDDDGSCWLCHTDDEPVYHGKDECPAIMKRGSMRGDEFAASYQRRLPSSPSTTRTPNPFLDASTSRRSLSPTNIDGVAMESDDGEHIDGNSPSAKFQLRAVTVESETPSSSGAHPSPATGGGLPLPHTAKTVHLLVPPQPPTREEYYGMRSDRDEAGDIILPTTKRVRSAPTPKANNADPNAPRVKRKYVRKTPLKSASQSNPVTTTLPVVDDGSRSAPLEGVSLHPVPDDPRRTASAPSGSVVPPPSHPVNGGRRAPSPPRARGEDMVLDTAPPSHEAIAAAARAKATAELNAELAEIRAKAAIPGAVMGQSTVGPELAVWREKAIKLGVVRPQGWPRTESPPPPAPAPAPAPAPVPAPPASGSSGDSRSGRHAENPHSQPSNRAAPPYVSSGDRNGNGNGNGHLSAQPSSSTSASSSRHPSSANGNLSQAESSMSGAGGHAPRPPPSKPANYYDQMDTGGENLNPNIARPGNVNVQNGAPQLHVNPNSGPVARPNSSMAPTPQNGHNGNGPPDRRPPPDMENSGPAPSQVALGKRKRVEFAAQEDRAPLVIEGTFTQRAESIRCQIARLCEDTGAYAMFLIDNKPDFEGSNALQYVSLNLEVDEPIRRHVYKMQAEVASAFYSASVTRIAEVRRRRVEELENVLLKERQAAHKERETIAMLLERLKEPVPWAAASTTISDR